MDPITMSLLFGGAGLLKSALFDAPKREKAGALAGETTRYSPWTGLKAQQLPEVDPIGSMLQYGATGASIGNNMESQSIENARTKAMTDFYNRGGTGSYANDVLPVRVNNFARSKEDFDKLGKSIWSRPYGGQ